MRLNNFEFVSNNYILYYHYPEVLIHGQPVYAQTLTHTHTHTDTHTHTHTHARTHTHTKAFPPTSGTIHLDL